MSWVDDIERDFKQMLDEANGDLEVLNRLTKERIEKAKAYNIEWERQFKILMGYQNGGADLERKGRLEDAIVEYQKAVEYGKNSELFKINNYYHSYERLAVILRKLKMYGREVSVIREVLAEEIAESDRSKMEKRLYKALSLMNKKK